jgi:hypothetical protein
VELRATSQVCYNALFLKYYIYYDLFFFSFLVLGSNPGPCACYASTIPLSYSPVPNTIYYGLNVSPLNLYVEPPIPNVTEFGSGAFMAIIRVTKIGS